MRNPVRSAWARRCPSSGSQQRTLDVGAPQSVMSYPQRAASEVWYSAPGWLQVAAQMGWKREISIPVSYTHLTLPTKA
jgi:hypothetical protein